MTWSHDIHKQLQKYEVGIVSYIPDGGLTQLIQLCEQDSSINDGMLVAVLKVDAKELPRVLPPIDGHF